MVPIFRNNVLGSGLYGEIKLLELAMKIEERILKKKMKFCEY